MIFSRAQLNQLAQSNGFSINKLIANQKRLAILESKRVDLQRKIKLVVSSSSSDSLPVGSSLLMGTINTTLLTQFGYDDINNLIKEFDENDNEIKNINQSVKEEDEKIKKSLSILGDIDITKDMSSQVTQEVLLDSDLAEVKNNSQEILLMLSQSKSGSDVINTALAHIKENESKLATYLLNSRKYNENLTNEASTKIVLNNKLSSAVNDRLEELGKPKTYNSVLDKLNNKISNLPGKVKNGVLVGTFLTFFAMGVYTNNSGDSDKSKDKKG